MSHRYLSRPQRSQSRFALAASLLVLSLLILWIAVQVKWVHDRRTVIEFGDYYGDLFTRDSPGFKWPWPVRLVDDSGAYRIVVRSQAEVSRMQRLFPEATVVAADSVSGVPDGVINREGYLQWRNWRPAPSQIP